MPVGGALEGVAESQQRRLVEVRGDELRPNGQTARAEATGDGERRLSCQIERQREAQRAALQRLTANDERGVILVRQRRWNRQRRREQNVHLP